MTGPRCPRCDGTELEPCDVLLEASDRSESFFATHRCLAPKCREPFRYVPGRDRMEIHMRTFATTAAALLALVLVACSGPTSSPPVVPEPVAKPGATVSLLAIARDALSCPQGALTWSVVEPNGGSVTQAGDYTAPSCGPAFVAGTYHVQAVGCSRTVAIPVAVAEDVLAVDIVCGVVAGTNCCATSFSVAPGTTIQFYASVTYSCPGHVVYSPTAPPVSCP